MGAYIANRDGGKTNEQGGWKHLAKRFNAGVLAAGDFAVSQRAGGANMSVDVAAGDIQIDTGLGYHYYGYTDAVTNVSVPTADPSNPKNGILVAYEDQSVVSSAANNNPNALKFMVVAGTAAASPSDPTDGLIQSTIGAGNPFQKIQRIVIRAATSSILNSDLTDLRSFSNLAVTNLVNTAAIQDGAVTGAKIAVNDVTATNIINRTRSFNCHIQPGTGVTASPNFGAAIRLADETTQQADFSGVVPKDCVTGTATLAVYYTASAIGNISTKLYCWSKTPGSAMGAAGNQYDNSSQTLTAPVADTLYKATFPLNQNISADDLVSGSIVRATGDANTGELRIKSVSIEYTADM